MRKSVFLIVAATCAWSGFCFATELSSSPTSKPSVFKRAQSWFKHRSTTEHIDRLYAIVQWREVHAKITQQAAQRRKNTTAATDQAQQEEAIWLGILAAIEKTAEDEIRNIDAKMERTSAMIAANRDGQAAQVQESEDHREQLRALQQQKKACKAWAVLSKSKLKTDITAKSRYVDDVTRLLGELRSDEQALLEQLDRLQSEQVQVKADVVGKATMNMARAQSSLDAARSRSRARIDKLNTSYAEAIGLLTVKDMAMWRTVLQTSCNDRLEKCEVASIQKLRKKVARSGKASEMPDCARLITAESLASDITPLVVARCRYQYRKATKASKLKRKKLRPTDQLHKDLEQNWAITLHHPQQGTSDAWMSSLDAYLEQQSRPNLLLEPEPKSEPETVHQDLSDFLGEAGGE